MGVTPFVFNYDNWIAIFPEFSQVSQPAAEGYFDLAQLFMRNDGRGPICDPNFQARIMNLTTAHIAFLFSAQRNGTPDTNGPEVIPLVGRIANGSEGSVKVQIDFPDQQPNSAWWNQSKYGAAVWVALKPFRIGFFLPSRRRRVYNPPMRYWGFGAGI
jgi:Protein of unknown function (DUF4054)